MAKPELYTVAETGYGVWVVLDPGGRALPYASFDGPHGERNAHAFARSMSLHYDSSDPRDAGENHA